MKIKLLVIFSVVVGAAIQLPIKAADSTSDDLLAFAVTENAKHYADLPSLKYRCEAIYQGKEPVAEKQVLTSAILRKGTSRFIEISRDRGNGEPAVKTLAVINDKLSATWDVGHSDAEVYAHESATMLTQAEAKHFGLATGGDYLFFGSFGYQGTSLMADYSLKNTQYSWSAKSSNSEGHRVIIVQKFVKKDGILLVDLTIDPTKGFLITEVKGYAYGQLFLVEKINPIEVGLRKDWLPDTISEVYYEEGGKANKAAKVVWTNDVKISYLDSAFEIKDDAFELAALKLPEELTVLHTEASGEFHIGTWKKETGLSLPSPTR